MIRLRIPDMFMEKYKSIQAEALARFEDVIKKDTKISSALAAFSGGGTSNGTSGANASSRAAPSRTLASPQWNGEVPVNVRRRLALSAVGVADFESNNTLLGLNNATAFECF